MKSVYLIGSLRNPKVPELGCYLRSKGFEVFDSWFAAGPEADDKWQEYETGRGLSYQQALVDYAATHTFKFDLHHLNRCQMAVLLAPAGRSGHLELGWCVGKGKPSFVLFDKLPDRWDVMYRFLTGTAFSREELVDLLERTPC